MVAHDLVVSAATPEDAAVNFWVQGFDPAIHHFGETGVIRNFSHGDALIAQQATGAAG